MYQTVKGLAEEYNISTATVRRIAKEIEADTNRCFKPYDILKIGNQFRIDEKAFRYFVKHRSAIRKHQL